MKRFSILLIAITALAFATSCATVQDTVGKVLPDIEAKLSEKGVQISIGVDLEIFCFDEGGFVYNGINSVPMIGSLLLKAVPICEPEATE